MRSQSNEDRSIRKTIPDPEIPVSNAHLFQGEQLEKFFRDYARANHLTQASVLCSPFLRARQSMEYVDKGLRTARCATKKEFMNELRELSRGKYEALTDEEIKAEHPGEFKRMAAALLPADPKQKPSLDNPNHWYDFKYLEGDSLKEVAERMPRVVGYIKELESQNKDGTCIIVCHENVIKVLREILLNQPAGWSGYHDPVPNASVSLLTGGFEKGFEDKEIIFAAGKKPGMAMV